MSSAPTPSTTQQHTRNKHEARACFESAIAHNPQDSWTYHKLGLLLEEEFQDSKGSIQCYERAVELNSRNFAAYNSLGVALKHSYPKKAKECLLQSLEIEPEYSRAWKNLGLLYMNHFHEYRNARDALQEALRVDPNNCSVYCNLGLLLQTQFHDLSAAEQCFQAATIADPSNPIGFLRLAVLYTGKKKYLLAREAYEQSLKLCPDEVSVLIKYSKLLEEHCDELVGGKEVLKLVLTLDPSNKYAKNRLLWIQKHHFPLEYEALKQLHTDNTVSSSCIATPRRGSSMHVKPTTIVSGDGGESPESIETNSSSTSPPRREGKVADEEAADNVDISLLFSSPHLAGSTSATTAAIVKKGEDGQSMTVEGEDGMSKRSESSRSTLELDSIMPSMSSFEFDFCNSLRSSISAGTLLDGPDTHKALQFLNASHTSSGSSSSNLPRSIFQPSMKKRLTCPRNHPLRHISRKPKQYTPKATWACEECQKSIGGMELKLHGAFYCELCKYDLCYHCSGKPQKAHVIPQQPVLIGAGAFGEVYKEYDVHLGAYVAVKHIRRSTVKEVKKEVQLVQQFEGHPNIVRVHRLEEQPSEILVFMELMTGSVQNEVSKVGAIHEKIARRWICQALDGLEALHTHNPNPVVHRDVKPDNLLLSPAGVVKLSDFGISKYIPESTMVQTMAMKGTPYYLAPECFEHPPKWSAASDIWALGCSFVSMLTGRHPWYGYEKSFFTLKDDVAVAPKIPSSFASQGAQAVLQLMFQRDRKARPSAIALLQHPYFIGATEDDENVLEGSKKQQKGGAMKKGGLEQQKTTGGSYVLRGKGKDGAMTSFEKESQKEAGGNVEDEDYGVYESDTAYQKRCQDLKREAELCRGDSETFSNVDTATHVSLSMLGEMDNSAGGKGGLQHDNKSKPNDVRHQRSKEEGKGGMDLTEWQNQIVLSSFSGGPESPLSLEHTKNKEGGDVTRSPLNPSNPATSSQSVVLAVGVGGAAFIQGKNHNPTIASSSPSSGHTADSTAVIHVAASTEDGQGKNAAEKTEERILSMFSRSNSSSLSPYYSAIPFSWRKRCIYVVIIFVVFVLLVTMM